MPRDTSSTTDRIASIKKAQVVKSFCYTCPWTCPIDVFVRDGKIVYHKGNDAAPNNIGTRCAKGMASAWVTRDPDRLRHPLLRTNPKGEAGQFKRISWDEAFDFVAERLNAIRDKWGPEAVVYLTHHDPNGIFMVQLISQLYGSPNVSIGHGSACEGDRRSACVTTFGHIFPMHDFANANYALLWGMNVLGANQALFESRGLLDAKKRGCKLVVIDPSHTETAQKADEWIPIRPGTDAAMALAMNRVIVDEGLYDAAFVNNLCEGFDGFRDHLRERGYTPEWAAPICGVDAETIRRLAREFATTKPAISAIFKGSGYYTNGAAAGRACYLLDAITGQVDGPGNLHLQEFAAIGMPAKIPEEAMTKPGKPPLAHAMGYKMTAPTSYPVLPEIPNARLPDAVLNDDPYPVRGLIVQAANPVMSDPNRERMQAMFAGLDLAVAVEIYMSETALECDLVLPNTSFFEQAEIRQGLWLGAEAILGQPAVAPVGEAKPMYDIVRGIADRMGWGEYFDFERWEDWAENRVENLPVGLDHLKEHGFWAGEINYGKPVKGLATKSGKVEIYSHAYADAGHCPYPEWQERSVIPDEDYPLQLTHSKLSMHCNIVTQNNPMLMEICSENWVEINQLDAARYGVSDGQMVILESPKDQIEIRATVVEGLMPGAVSVRHGHGFGHWAMGSIAKGKGAHSNNLMDTHTNPFTGTSSFNECKVRIRPA